MIQNKPENWIELLQNHLTWYPRMELRDVYKLFYQGTMGSEHLVAYPQAFSKYLTEEFEPLQADPSERLLEPIRPDQTLFRINLRPYKALNLPVDVLVPGLLETTQVFTSDLEGFKHAWTGFGKACEQGQVSNFEVGDIHTFTAWVEGLGFPAIHHSGTYSLAYQPAYRLILAQSAGQLGLGEPS
jgi:hypothetical protein